MSNTSTLWADLWKENRPYLWIALAVAIGSDAIILAVRYAEGMPLQLSLYNVLITTSIVVITLIAVNTIYVLKKLFLERCQTRTQVMLLKSLGLYVGVIAGTLLFEYIYHYFGFEDNDYIVIGSLQFSASTSEVISNVVLATLIGLPIFFRQQVQEKSRVELKRKAEELETAHELNTRAQLEALQARVNPHFLYNSLNSIASLIHINPDQAEQMVLSLSELFRYSLNYSNGQIFTVAQEVKMVETYLSIELIRFGDKLTCDIEVDDKLANTEIPRFILQPLVENAIKHGTSKIAQGEIRVRIQQEGSDIVFTVADNGPDFPEDFEVGYGIKCITDQLELLYKDQHAFSMLNTPFKHVRIVLTNALPDAASA